MEKAMQLGGISFRGVHAKRLAVLVGLGLLLIWAWTRSRSRSGATDYVQSDLIDYSEKHFVQGGFRLDGGAHSMTEGTSLTFEKRQFLLKGKPLKILSGAMHYFRVVPEYWKDRMLKMKSCGLNTLETYVSWNLHEPVPGIFTFDGMLDVRRYIEVAQEVGLYVIFRPGPYICSEWDFGGMPSWLLADPNMKVRSNYAGYKKAAERFFNKLIPMITKYQYSQGGPIIAVQVENEFGSYSDEVAHLSFIKQLLQKNGITELLVTSDNLSGMRRAPFYRDALPMANFQDIGKSKDVFEVVREFSDAFPLMVMEYWSGWFDHWGKEHEIYPVEDFARNLKAILANDSSVNFYMFHGGTNFGFMAGANFFEDYKPDVTSYDYDAPLDEAGNITPKYEKAREIIMEYVLKKQGITSLPDPPPNTDKAKYGRVAIEKYLSWTEMIGLMETTVNVLRPEYMEMIKLETGVGQSYGYIVYRRTISAGTKQTLTLPGFVRDRAQILVNSKEVEILDWKKENNEIKLEDVPNDAILDIVVENLGRVNYILAGSNLLNEQRKGISGDVYLDDKKLEDWKIFPMEFQDSYVQRLSRATWKDFTVQVNTPGMYKAYLDIKGNPQDTYILMKGWKKGIVFINGFNIGRYWNIGPQRTLYIPGPKLKPGKNEILIFELHQPDHEVEFQNKPDLG